MEHYRKEKSINHKLENPFADVLKGENICKVQISEYSQLSKVLGYAISRLRNPSTQFILVQGQGKALNKVGNCVRILMTKHDVRLGIVILNKLQIRKSDAGKKYI